MHIVGHFLNLVVLSFVCFYLVNFRWCGRPTFPHEWFLKTVSQRLGETKFWVLPFQKLSRQHPFGLLELEPSRKDPIQKRLPPWCGHISAHKGFCSDCSGSGGFPQVLAKSLAMAHTPTHSEWMHQVCPCPPAVWLEKVLL